MAIVQLDAQILFNVFTYSSLHVSSMSCSSSGETNCINTASGNCHSVLVAVSCAGWVVNATPWPHLTPWKDPVPIVQEAGWAAGPVCTSVENLASTGIRSPDRLFFTSALEGDGWSKSRRGRNLPPGKTRYPLYRRMVRPQGRSGQVRKILPPPGFDPRTVYFLPRH